MLLCVTQDFPTKLRASRASLKCAIYFCAVPKVRHFSSSISEEIVSAHCVVEGTRRYDVSLRITHSALVAQCTCPRCADTGSCKHIAAALLRLEQQMKEVSVTQVMGTVKERRELMDAVADGSKEGILT